VCFRNFTIYPKNFPPAAGQKSFEKPRRSLGEPSPPGINNTRGGGKKKNPDF